MAMHQANLFEPYQGEVTRTAKPTWYKLKRPSQRDAEHVLTSCMLEVDSAKPSLFHEAE